MGGRTPPLWPSAAWERAPQETPVDEKKRTWITNSRTAWRRRKARTFCSTPTTPSTGTLGREAFAKAKKEDKPIFLSIGYSTCHWCHVMEHESFEDEEVAKSSTSIRAIKVDREERPDVDQIYMAAVQAMTSHGGWPLSAWLTPDLKPFMGGTYFPKEDRFGRPASSRS
jgi:thiol:disulfide interchange protein